MLNAGATKAAKPNFWNMSVPRASTISTVAREGLGGKCSFRTVDTLLVKHCDVGMRLRYEIECIGYVGLFRPRTPDSPTTFRLPAGGRGDVIVALEPVQWANSFRLIPYGERPRLYCDTGGAQLGVTVRMA